MGKHKGNPYGIRLIATSGPVLAGMLRELDEWYGRTPAERGDGTDWHADAIGWKNEAETRGLELDRLKAELTAATQHAQRVFTDRNKLESSIGNLKREHATEAERLQALATNALRDARDARQETRTANERAERLNTQLSRNAAALNDAEQQRDQALNKQANLELKVTELTDENAALRLGVDPADWAIGGAAPDDARTINTRTVEYETRPPISTSGLQHIESCNSPLWQTPDSDGINPVCNKPKNHPGPHRGNHEGDPVSWLITTNSNNSWGGNAIID